VTTANEETKDLAPPVAERRPHVIEAHGDRRVDDWYWVRDKSDPAVLSLLEQENAFTKKATAHLDPLAEEVYGEILARTKLSDVTYPAPRGEWAYYVRTQEESQHAIHCRRRSSAPLPLGLLEDAALDRDDPDEFVILDENELAEGHEYLVVGDRALSPDQRLLAYAIDTTGGELMAVRIRDLEEGKDLEDVIEGAYYGLVFAADNKTLYYTRPDESLRPYQLWRHRLGSPVEEDEKVFEELDERFFLGVEKTKDGSLVMIELESSLTSEWHYLPAEEPTALPRVVAERRHGVLYSVEHHGEDFVLISNDEAQNFALFRAPVASPGRENWEVLLPERTDIRIEHLDVISGYALLEERGNATTSIRLFPLSGGAEHLIEAPPAACAFLGPNLEFETAGVRYETTSLIEPRSTWRYDLTGKSAELLRQVRVPGGYDPANYRTEQRLVTSQDGTEVPVTLAWRTDRPAGPGPAYLYGYGAYGISSDPVFNQGRPIHPLLDRGVLYVIAHVRGGEEMGRRWYLDGKFEHKHHSFEDFLAAARFLVDEGLTTPDRLAAHGGSAGGLLMGGTVNLDPSAFGAIVAEVPFVDCLTTMLDTSLPLTTNEWEEWGDPLSDKAAYEWIKAYSPYDNVRNERYPKMLVTGGLSDPRVGYFEPTKWVQKLRAAHAENPTRVLLRVELAAGHFGPSGRFDAWQKRAFVLAFVLDAIGARKRLAPLGA
jgi:oligopeptidase B